MVIFTLLTSRTLNINYHRGMKVEIFGLARLAPWVTELALKDDSFWEYIHTKPPPTADVDSSYIFLSIIIFQLRLWFLHIF